MRKFLGILTGVCLAFLILGGLIAYRNGWPMKDIFSLERWQSWVLRPATLEPVSESESPALPADDKPLSYEERIKKGDYYFQRGFLTFAVNEYAKAAKQSPKSPDPYIKLLKAYFELGDFEKARRNAEVALSLDPQNLEAQMLLVSVYLKQSQFTEAEALVDKLRLARPEDKQLDYQKGLLLASTSRPLEAKPFFVNAALDPLLKEKADLFLKAYDEYEFAKAAEILYLEELLARSLNQTQEYELSISLTKSILKRRPDLRDAWIMLGFSYLNLNKYYFAQTAFEKAYELDTQWPITQYFLGLTHMELGNFKDAALFLEYANQNGFEPQILVKRKLADLHLENKEYAKAVALYEEILNISNQDIASFVRPIWLYLDFLNDPVKALGLAEKAVIAFPNDAMSYNLLGWSQTGANKLTEAETNLKKATELNPDFAAAFYNLGKLYMTQNRKTEALDAFKKAYELDQTGSIGSLAAQRYNELSNP